MFFFRYSTLALKSGKKTQIANETKMFCKPPRAAKRSNWLLVHKGDSALRVSDFSAVCESEMVHECHSTVFDDGKVLTFVHTVLQVHESSIRIAAKKILMEIEFEVISFKNARCAFNHPGIRQMAMFFKSESPELISSWLKKGAKVGFFFGALIKKLDPALKYPMSSTEKRNELEDKIKELESERNFYKQKYEALAEQFLHAEF